MRIDEPYLLAVCVPIKIDRNGTRWCNELWAKDLALHLDYLSDLTLACPRVFGEPSDTDQPLAEQPFDRLKFIDLPASRSYREALIHFPELILKIWRGVKAVKIVHAGFGGWPISEGAVAIPIARLQKKYIISYVESSFWRTSRGDKSWRRRLRSALLERLNRLCVKLADLRFFTSRAYENDFLGTGDHSMDHAYVTPATWIDERQILNDEEAVRAWTQKDGKIRLLFAARLVPEKGLRVLLDAIERVAQNVDLHITIIGDGPLKDESVNFVSRHTDTPVNLNYMEPVPYGAPFFDIVRCFDAVIIPSTSDEQPRLIFDGYAQAVPILGAWTGGIAEVIEDGVTGKLFRTADPSSLAEILKWASTNRAALRLMGLAALKKSRQFTHQAMHEQRSKIIAAERKLANRG